MNDWFSAPWEANWRPFHYFNLYRLILVGFSLLAAFLPTEWADPLQVAKRPGLLGVALIYFGTIFFGLILSLRWRHRFNLQLSLQVSADVVVVGMLMFSAGGVTSGVGLLLVISLAAASLVGTGRLVLFYAAQATLMVLGSQIFGVATRGFDQASIVQAGILSGGFFATAILARLLGQRVMFNEDLARRRGRALQNQELIGQRIIERMQDGVLVVAKDGLIQRSNPIAREMLDLSDTELTRLAEISPALDQRFRLWQTEKMEAGGTFSGVGGRRLQVRFESTDSSDAEVLIYLEDVERVQERAEQLKLASLGRLTASIAHEIRNPLSAISHASELLREERRQEIQDRLLRIVNDNVGRLDRIVQNVLELGRRDRANPEFIPLYDFCRHFVEQFCAAQDLAQDIFVLTGDSAHSLEFDRSHLHQVLWNLLSNAVRYSKQQGASIRIEVSASDGQLELHVIDDGPGVPQEVRHQVFEPFFTTHLKGTGLGLFIARELCEANRASLHLAGQSVGGHFILRGKVAA
jgi:two-component system, NtrC family, sensor histidine kinase PilS